MNSIKRTILYSIMLLLLSMLLVCTLPTAEAKPLLLDGTAEIYPLANTNLDILEDKTGTLTITDVTSSRYSQEFKPSRQQIPNFGITDSAFWFRFTIDPGESGCHDKFLFIDNPLLDEADLYLPQDNGSYRIERAGISRVPAVAAVTSRIPILPLTALSAPATCYLRLREPGRAVFPLSIMTYDAVVQEEVRGDLLMAGYAGVMLTVFLLNTLLFLMIGERHYLALMFLVLFTALLNLFAKGHLLRILPEIAIRNHFTIIVWFACGITIAGIIFGRQFLKGEQHAWRSDRLLSWFYPVICIVAAVTPLIPTTLSMQLIRNLNTIASILLVWLAFSAYSNGFKPALYYLMSYFVLGSYSVWMALVITGILPYNNIASNFLTINSVTHVIFIYLALGANFREIARRNRALIADLGAEVQLRTAANIALEEEMATRARLEREIVRISDDERRRMSHELHDGLCQQLTGARLRFAALSDSITENGLRSETESLSRLLDETVDHAYRLSRGLWTTDAGGKGALLDLGDLAREFAGQSGIKIELEQRQLCPSCTGENLPQVHLIAREAILNSVKHSEASTIAIRLECDRTGGILLEVRDNGHGITENPDTPGGMGMKIMKHRAEMIGGTLRIEPVEGGGTVVYCSAPCRNATGDVTV